MELWQPWPVEPRYEVSTYGRVLNTLTGNLVKGSVNRDGHIICRVTIGGETTGKKRQRVYNGERARRYIHTMVLETFLRPRAAGEQCRHLDGKHENNYIGNLIWGTAAENAQDRTRHGKHHSQILSDEQALEIINEWKFRAKDGEIKQQISEDLADRYGVVKSTIDTLVYGHKRKHLKAV